jgi:hypothetical protein
MSRGSSTRSRRHRRAAAAKMHVASTCRPNCAGSRSSSFDSRGGGGLRATGAELEATGHGREPLWVQALSADGWCALLRQAIGGIAPQILRALSL